MSVSSSPATLDLRLTSMARLALLIPVGLALLAGWFSIRWYVGNTISEVVTTDETPNPDLAGVAVRWAPADPFVHWRLGALAQRDFSASNLQETVQEFETAVTLSPNDFRYWDELGRALEAAGDADAAERAQRQATNLAPNYYYPRWHLGNLLLRQGKFQEAFPHLFRAAQANNQLWPQVLNLAWQAYDGNVDRIADEACKEPPVRVTFAIYLVGVQRYDDALRLWQTMSANDRRQLVTNGRALRKALFDAKRFHAALEISREVDAAGSESPVAEKFSNGGFERPVTLPTSRPFGWAISSNVQAQISISDDGHSSLHSMRVVFSAANRLDRINAWQTIVVESNTQYHFEYYARTEKLSSASTPVVIVLDASDGTPLTYSLPLPTGTNDWQKIALDFKTKNSDGIIVMIGRLPCTVGDVCPIFGTVWYDEFNLQRGGGSGGSRRSAAASFRSGNGVNRRPA